MTDTFEPTKDDQQLFCALRLFILTQLEQFTAAGRRFDGEYGARPYARRLVKAKREAHRHHRLNPGAEPISRARRRKLGWPIGTDDGPPRRDGGGNRIAAPMQARFLAAVADVEALAPLRINLPRGERLEFAEKLLLMTWLITDPDITEETPRFTEFQAWDWRPRAEPEPPLWIPEGEEDHGIDFWLDRFATSQDVFEEHPRWLELARWAWEEIHRELKFTGLHDGARQEVEPREDEGEVTAPSLTEPQRLTLLTLNTFDASILASLRELAEAMRPGEALSERTIGPAIQKLVALDLAERPEGDRQGARLTLKGRRLASKIAD